MPTWKMEDDENINPHDFTRADVLQIKELLAKAEDAKSMHIFTVEEVTVLRRIIKTFTDHGIEIEEMVKRERVSQMWGELRLRGWGVVKWFLAGLITIAGAFQAWDWLVARLWSGK